MGIFRCSSSRPGYPPTMYTQPSSSFGPQPQQHGYQSYHAVSLVRPLDLSIRSSMGYQSYYSVNGPRTIWTRRSIRQYNHELRASAPSMQFGMPAGNLMSAVVSPSFNPNAAQPSTRWLPYNYNQPYNPSLLPTNTPAPAPGSGFRVARTDSILPRHK
ncbi:hypothetical protein B0H13DRAFT_1059371 [Mycena leptocephala]|nr:hypothetical protein B0H13DRAFT_1059371 [Mycena leptocephala]